MEWSAVGYCNKLGKYWQTFGTVCKPCAGSLAQMKFACLTCVIWANRRLDEGSFSFFVPMPHFAPPPVAREFAFYLPKCSKWRPLLHDLTLQMPPMWSVPKCLQMQYAHTMQTTKNKKQVYRFEKHWSTFSPCNRKLHRNGRRNKEWGWRAGRFPWRLVFGASVKIELQSLWGLPEFLPHKRCFSVCILFSFPFPNSYPLHPSRFTYIDINKN